jgi:hypothetical protein
MADKIWALAKLKVQRLLETKFFADQLSVRELYNNSQEW